ncbi:unnamed protein product [Ceutorhynchus assimilis]|uniref:Uncharacterized protein n=1 Tax=Ceutorhynchus assimilis TaxID=467358 RepID=A0A9N9MR40_9CUCU|nr:unnamed protein product [Ceutorhynchus assimilis]
MGKPIMIDSQPDGASKEPRDKIAIGIDLGTTFTAAAVFRNNNPEIIINKEGNRLTLSAVFYPPENLSPIVGELGEDRSTKCPNNFIYDTKRIIGRSNDDVYVNNFISKEKARKFGMQLCKEFPGNSPYIKLVSTNKDSKNIVTPEQVSAEILKYIKESAEIYLGSDVTEAVISIPAYFSYPQREATKRAAESVGLTVLKLITEPVAAAIHYTHGKIVNDTRLLVVDLGGGTLDVSVIKCTKDKFEVLAVEGDMFLGGRDFDEIIFEYLRQQIARFGTSITDPNTSRGQRFLYRLKKIAVKYKKYLSLKHEYSMDIDCGADEVYEIALSRVKFEELSRELFDRVINKIRKCLEINNISKESIDKVVLTGGSTRIPKIYEELTKLFNGKKPYADLNPDEAVALGASIHVALLKNNLQQLETYQLREVAPHSLGILAKYDLMVTFIQKGTVLPAYVKQVMETSENDQQSVVFNIYEGERKHCIHNKKIGEFIIADLPSGKAGEIEFEVFFILDENGLLQVKASEIKTKKSNNLKIKMENLSLCDNSIHSLEYESLIDETDRQYEEFYRLRLLIDTYCSRIIYDVEQPFYKTKKDVLIKKIDKFKKVCEPLPFKEIDILRAEYEKLQRRINDTLNSKLED